MEVYMIFETIDINKKMREYKVHGLSLSLIDNGTIKSSEGFGVLESGSTETVESSSIFNACSMSKFVTSILALKLVDDGILDLDENINHRLTSWQVPENEFTLKEKVTLRKLLSHQSGFTDPDNSFGPYNSKDGIPTILDLLDGKQSYYPKSAKVNYEPGSDFVYSDIGFCIIELLIEDVTGQPFHKLMDTLIFQPLGMKNSTLEYSIPESEMNQYASGHHKSGKIVTGKYPIYPYSASAGLWSTPENLCRLVMEIYGTLQGNSTLGITKETMSALLAPQGCSKWTGLGVFLDFSDEQVEMTSLGWGIGFQSMMIAYPRLGKGAVIMMNSDPGVHQLKALIGEIVKALTQQYHWPTH